MTLPLFAAAVAGVVKLEMVRGWEFDDTVMTAIGLWLIAVECGPVPWLIRWVAIRHARRKGTKLGKSMWFVLKDSQSDWMRAFEPCRSAIMRAKRVAVEHRHAELDRIHLLIGLLEQPEVAKLLTDLGAGPSAIRAELSLTPGDAPEPRRFPFSRQTKLALDYSWNAALNRGQDTVVPLQLFLGLLEVDNKGALDALLSRNVNSNALREEIVKRLPGVVAQ